VRRERAEGDVDEDDEEAASYVQWTLPSPPPHMSCFAVVVFRFALLHMLALRHVIIHSDFTPTELNGRGV
jgi:hypothetical protein